LKSCKRAVVIVGSSRALQQEGMPTIFALRIVRPSLVSDLYGN